ncbi:hypothetical protein PG994_004203 [Apiospora phragmitis]|uniref:Uncharacterized protein n=1 Tax=Apiospora phragmitis TaxID=2905665 RepID=A0ABR1VPX9_9PEZI
MREKFLRPKTLADSHQSDLTLIMMAMLGLGYPDSKYKECVEKLGVRWMDQSREALHAEERWTSDAIFFAEYRRLLGEDFEKCRKDMCPFAQPWTKEALQLKPYADAGLSSWMRNMTWTGMPTTPLHRRRIIPASPWRTKRVQSRRETYFTSTNSGRNTSATEPGGGAEPCRRAPILGNGTRGGREYPPTAGVRQGGLSSAACYNQSPDSAHAAFSRETVAAERVVRMTGAVASQVGSKGAGQVNVRDAAVPFDAVHAGLGSKRSRAHASA